MGGQVTIYGRAILLGFMVAGLTACQTTPNQEYARIGAGPDIDVAYAQCSLASTSAGGGYVAMGSPSFVAGAAIGAALSDEMQKQQFIKQCMAVKGWKPVAAGKGLKLNAGNSTSQNSQLSSMGPFPPPPKQ